jgi:5-methylcytosine-specific restriction endonuclease McrA
MAGSKYGPKKPPGGKIDREKLDQVVANAHRARDERMRGYREQSLKIHPWVCGRCGRSFTLKNLHELTVHHKDHNHDNNPPDGSNWENLCIYCHDYEHQKHEEYLRGVGVETQSRKTPESTHKPFADLKALLDKK